jgi:hypothetical protein
MQKKLIVLCVILISAWAISTESEVENLLKSGYEKQEHRLNLVHLNKKTEDGSHSIVYLKENPAEGINYGKMMNKLLNYDKKTVNDALLSCSRGSKPDFFKFAAEHVATFGTSDSPQTTSFASPCFESTTMSFAQIDASTAEVTVVLAKPTSLTCSDTYLFGTTLNYHFENFFFRGTHKVTFKNLNATQMSNVKSFGIHAFRFCDSVGNLIPDVLLTALLFVGGLGTNPNIPFFGSKPTFWMEMANEAFIKKSTGYQWQPRNDVLINLDESEIKSGDYLAITRFDGVDQIIQYGTGSHSGHSTVALWIDGVLHIIESQDGWYWPKHGIQRNTYKQWVEWANNAGFNVAVLPLKPELAAKFNETAAYEWFKTVEGLPYGYHNFLFSWIDTVDTSYPPLLDPDFVSVVFSILEKFVPSVVDTFLGQALNKRIGTEGLKMSQIAEEIAKRNLTFPELYAIVEKEGWVYNDGLSYVCSCFVTAIWKAGGLFEGMDVIATEFTPRDVYQINFFDENYKKPKACQDADPELPYCQIMGKHKMILPGFNTVKPYSHMNERCPSVPPLYEREDGC